MQTIWRIQTNDGEIHVNTLAAKHHLEKKIGETMLPLSHKLTHVGAYLEMTDILSSKVFREQFREVIALFDEVEAGVIDDAEEE